MSDVTQAALQTAVAEEIARFLEENRAEIIKRALSRLRKERKEASGDEQEA